MIYAIDDKTFFGELKNSTSGSPTDWGILFNEEEFILSISKSEWKKTTVNKDQMELARVLLNDHIKTINNEHNRLNEIFNLVSSNGDPNLIEHAYARNTQTFLAESRTPKACEIYVVITTVDKDFAHMENLVSATPLIEPNRHLHQIPFKYVDSVICNYLTGRLAVMDRLQYMLRNSRRDEEKSI